MHATLEPVRVLGGILLHFLWQGSVIAIITAAALRTVARGTARLRYLICVCAWLACIAAPAITLLLLTKRPSEVAADASVAGPVVQFMSTVPLPRTMSAEPSSSFEIMNIVVGLWLLGVFLVSAYYAMQWRGVNRVRQHSVPLSTPQELAEIATRLLKCWKATTRVPVRVSEFVSSPAVIGVLRPIIVFPAATLARMSATDFELILLHEIAHIIRRDTWVNATQVMLEIVFFYHPAIHWLSRRTRLERECACDDFVVNSSGSAYQYAQALTTLAMAHHHEHRIALALGAAGGDLLPRLRYLAGECIEGDTYPRNRLQLALLVLIFGSICMPTFIGRWLRPLADEPVFVEPSRKDKLRAQQPSQPALPRAENDDRRTASADTMSRATPAAATRISSPTLQNQSSPATDSRDASDSENTTQLSPEDEEIAPGALRPLDPSEITNALGAQPSIESAAQQTPTSTAASGAAITAISPQAAAGELSISTTYHPLPEYPVRARLEGVQGAVSAIVRVGADGRPKGLHIVSAEPLGVFEGSVRRALMRWRYDLSHAPKPSEGMEVAYQLRFTISGVASTATGICATATASRTCMPH